MAKIEMRGGESIIVRHADKGIWQISEQGLAEVLPEEQKNLVMGVLKREFPQMIENGETPLKLEGLQRSLRLAEKMFEQLPDECVLVALDSGKDRAQLCRHLVTARLGQLETRHNKKQDMQEKTIDMLEIDEKEITNFLADSHPDTWGPYAQMMKNEGISEEEAIFRWLNDMNADNVGIDPQKSPKESSERYRQLVQLIHSSIIRSDNLNSDRRQPPVVMFAVGHSGSLGQTLYEDRDGNINVDDIPTFCEEFKFNRDGQIVETERIDL